MAAISSCASSQRWAGGSKARTPGEVSHLIVTSFLLAIPRFVLELGSVFEGCHVEAEMRDWIALR
jgi:hypothetical protein